MKIDFARKSHLDSMNLQRPEDKTLLPIGVRDSFQVCFQELALKGCFDANNFLPLIISAVRLSML